MLRPAPVHLRHRPQSNPLVVSIGIYDREGLGDLSWLHLCKIKAFPSLMALPTWAKAYLSYGGSTVASESRSEHLTALNPMSYQLVTASWRLIAEVLGLGLLAAGRRRAALSYGVVDLP
jgi:hypothetical protein